MCGRTRPWTLSIRPVRGNGWRDSNRLGLRPQGLPHCVHAALSGGQLTARSLLPSFPQKALRLRLRVQASRADRGQRQGLHDHLLPGGPQLAPHQTAPGPVHQPARRGVSQSYPTHPQNSVQSKENSEELSVLPEVFVETVDEHPRASDVVKSCRERHEQQRGLSSRHPLPLLICHPG